MSPPGRIGAQQQTASMASWPEFDDFVRAKVLTANRRGCFPIYTDFGPSCNGQKILIPGRPSPPYWKFRPTHRLRLLNGRRRDWGFEPTTRFPRDRAWVKCDKVRIWGERVARMGVSCGRRHAARKLFCITASRSTISILRRSFVAVRTPPRRTSRPRRTVPLPVLAMT